VGRFASIRHPERSEGSRSSRQRGKTLFDNRSVTKERNAPLAAGGGAKPEALGERDSLGPKARWSPTVRRWGDPMHDKSTGTCVPVGMGL